MERSISAVMFSYRRPGARAEKRTRKSLHLEKSDGEVLHLSRATCDRPLSSPGKAPKGEEKAPKREVKAPSSRGLLHRYLLSQRSVRLGFYQTERVRAHPFPFAAVPWLKIDRSIPAVGCRSPLKLKRAGETALLRLGGNPGWRAALHHRIPDIYFRPKIQLQLPRCHSRGKPDCAGTTRAPGLGDSASSPAMR